MQEAWFPEICSTCQARIITVYQLNSNYISLSLVRLHYYSLQVVGVFGVGQDITELRDAGTLERGFQTNRSSARSGKHSKLAWTFIVRFLESQSAYTGFLLQCACCMEFF